jgi:hypothetical protein
MRLKHRLLVPSIGIGCGIALCALGALDFPTMKGPHEVVIWGTSGAVTYPDAVEPGSAVLMLIGFVVLFIFGIQFFIRHAERM